MKEHEKFWAFMALIISVMAIAMLAYFRPIEDGSGSQRILDASLGGLLLALGGAANALFRIRESAENEVKVTNTPSEPVPTEPKAANADGELPEDQKL